MLESTTYPGTTEELFRPILESSGCERVVDFLLAYSPERIDPGNGDYGLGNTPKIVAGIYGATGAARARSTTAHREGRARVDRREAELTKLLENTFRT